MSRLYYSKQNDIYREYKKGDHVIIIASDLPSHGQLGTVMSKHFISATTPYKMWKVQVGSDHEIHFADDIKPTRCKH